MNDTAQILESPRVTVVLRRDLQHTRDGKYRGYAHLGFPDYPSDAPGFMDLPPLQLVAQGLLYPAEGFDMHDHVVEDHINIVLSGTLRHRDSLGGDALVRAGDVGNLCAGTGARHAEHVYGQDPVRAITICVSPMNGDLPPAWHHGHAPDERIDDAWRVVATGRGPLPQGAVPVRQDVEIRLLRATARGRHGHALAAGRRAYVMSTDADILVGGVPAEAGDRVLVQGGGDVEIEPAGPTDLLLIDLP